MGSQQPYHEWATVRHICETEFASPLEGMCLTTAVPAIIARLAAEAGEPAPCDADCRAVVQSLDPSASGYVSHSGIARMWCEPATLAAAAPGETPARARSTSGLSRGETPASVVVVGGEPRQWPSTDRADFLMRRQSSGDRARAVALSPEPSPAAAVERSRSAEGEEQLRRRERELEERQAQFQRQQLEFEERQQQFQSQQLEFEQQQQQFQSRQRQGREDGQEEAGSSRARRQRAEEGEPPEALPAVHHSARQLADTGRALVSPPPEQHQQRGATGVAAEPLRDSPSPSQPPSQPRRGSGRGFGDVSPPASVPPHRAVKHPPSPCWLAPC